MLEKRIRTRFKEHIKKGGLLTAPEILLTAVLKTTARWLRRRESEYRAAGSFTAADALRDLQSDLLKKD